MGTHAARSDTQRQKTLRKCPLASTPAAYSCIHSGNLYGGNIEEDIEFEFYFFASKKIIFSGTLPEFMSVCLAKGGALIGAGMPAPT